jgi:hypothetical protein
MDNSYDDLPEIHFDCSDGKALQLVRINENKKFELIEETVNFLKEIDGGVAICSVVGKYRSGKSFLMNKILELSGKNGFQVSSSVNACTKGLWIWSKPIYNDKENMNIFFMDTEGLDSVDRDDQVDSKLFALSVLLSSYFIFNSIGAIDENSINTLALITQLIKTVTINDKELVESSYQLSQYAPKFLWILRDFVLEVKDLQGRIVSPKLYLESILTDLPVGNMGFTRNAEKSIKTRESILNFFKNRDCITLIRPVNNETDLRNIQFLSDTEIRPGFLKQLHSIRDKIYRECNQKIINGVSLNMVMFLSFLSEFVTSFNQNKIPAIQSAWENLLENECLENYDQAVNLYESEIFSFQKENKTSQLLDLHKYLNQLRDYTMNFYSKCSYIKERNPNVYKKYNQQLTDFIDRREKKIIEQFNQKADDANCEIIVGLYDQFCNDENSFKENNPIIISKKAREKILNQYHQNNVGGENSRSFLKNTESNSFRLFNSYLSNLNNVVLKKKKSIVRKNEIGRENYENDIQNLKIKEEKLHTLKQEIEFNEERLQNINLTEIDEKEFNKLKERNENLKNTDKRFEGELQTNSQKLQLLRREIEDLEKKKKGCC